HAIMCARQDLAPYRDVIVLSGDVPLIRPETIERLCRFHIEHRAAMTVLTTIPAEPFGYGRIVRKRGIEIAAIIEQNALKGKQLKIAEINSGIYAFRVKTLFAHLDRLKTDNVHREFYLTD